MNYYLMNNFRLLLMFFFLINYLKNLKIHCFPMLIKSHCIFSLGILMNFQNLKQCLFFLNKITFLLYQFFFSKNYLQFFFIRQTFVIINFYEGFIIHKVIMKQDWEGQLQIMLFLILFFNHLEIINFIIQILFLNFLLLLNFISFNFHSNFKFFSY